MGETCPLNFSLGQASQPGHYWYFGHNTSLLWDCPLYCRPFSSNPGFYPLEASSILLQLCYQNVSRHGQMSPGEGCAKFHSQLRTTGLKLETRFYKPIITMQWEGLEFVGSTVGALRREQPDTLEWKRKMNASIYVKHPPMTKYVQNQTVTMIDNRRHLLSIFYVSWTVLNILQTLII